MGVGMSFPAGLSILTMIPGTVVMGLRFCERFTYGKDHFQDTWHNQPSG